MKSRSHPSQYLMKVCYKLVDKMPSKGSTRIFRFSRGAENDPGVRSTYNGVYRGRNHEHNGIGEIVAPRIGLS